VYAYGVTRLTIYHYLMLLFLC